MKFYTKAMVGLSFALLLVGCGGERTVKSSEAAKIAEKLSFANTHIVSGEETCKITSCTVEGGLNSYAQKEANKYSQEEESREITTPSDYMITASLIKTMGDKSTTYKVNGTAISFEDTYIQTTFMPPLIYRKDVELCNYASNGMLEKMISTSTCAYSDDSSYVIVWEYTYTWVVSE